MISRRREAIFKKLAGYKDRKFPNSFLLAAAVRQGLAPEIPVSKQGKKLYFNKTELLAWIRSGRKSTIAELANFVSLIRDKRRSHN